MLHTALLMLGVGIFAGIMGSILGIGGGMIVTPIVTLAMGLDIKYRCHRNQFWFNDRFFKR